MDTTAFAAHSAADPGVIGVDMFIGVAADPVLIRAHHASPKLVENLKRRFVTRTPELALKLYGRHTECLAGNQLGRHV